MSIKLTKVAAGMGLAALLSPAFAQVPTNGFDFQVLAKTAAGGSPVINLPGSSAGLSSTNPVINNNGVVTFRVLFNSGAIWYGLANGAGQVVYETDPDVDALVGDPSLNDSGIAVWAETNGGAGGAFNGLWRYDPANPPAALLTSRPAGSTAWANPTINSAGNIGTRASLPGGQVFAVVAANGQSSTLVASQNAASGPYYFLYTPQFNNNGDIAARVQTGSSTTVNQIILFKADGSTQVIASDQGADPASTYPTFASNSVALNNNGQVVFYVRYSNPTATAILRSDGTNTVEIARTGNGTVGTEIEAFAPAINDDGVVVFRARDPQGRRSLYMGDGTTLIQVATEGTNIPLPGGGQAQIRFPNSTAFIGNPDVNNSEQVAFTVGLVADQTSTRIGSAVIVATPKRATIPGDTDLSGCVDDADLTNMILDFGGPGGSGGGAPGTDVNNDGIVDDADLTELILSFGVGC